MCGVYICKHADYFMQITLMVPDSTVSKHAEMFATRGPRNVITDLKKKRQNMTRKKLFDINNSVVILFYFFPPLQLDVCPCRSVKNLIYTISSLHAGFGHSLHLLFRHISSPAVSSQLQSHSPHPL